MPTYDYECKTCGRFEFSQRITEDPLDECPKCGGNDIRRLISRNVGIIFKGPGFYVTDNRRSNGKGDNKEAASESSSKTEETADSTKAAS